jgi:NADPH:quinone reductase-like Zn-dependent oxidoreductase
LHYLRQARIQKGQKVLVYGASGSVGSFAVQLARHFGAEVTGVCSTANLELVKSLGADRVIDYTQEDFSAAGEVHDVVYDTVGKSSVARCMRALKRCGTYLQSGLPGKSVHLRWAAWRGGKHVFVGEPAKKNEYLENSADLEFLRQLVEAGTLTTVIDRTYPMDRIVEAHTYVDQGHKKGNVVIVVQPPRS